MNQDNLTIVDLLRHGEPVGGSRFRGNGVDDPLSEDGWRQMQQTTNALTGWDLIISSPMQRCQAFASHLAAERKLPLAIEPAFREVGFGAWEGQNREALRRDRAEEYLAFYRDPVNNRPAGAEPLADFGRRISEAFERVLAEHAGRHVLIVAHAGVIRATVGHVLQAPATHWYQAQVDYAALSRFAVDGAGARLIHHNWRPSL